MLESLEQRQLLSVTLKHNGDLIVTGTPRR